MRRTGVLLAAVALVVSACGSSASDAPTAGATTPADHAADSAQQEILAQALARFRAAGSGGYESEVTADGLSQPLAHEAGTFRLDPAAAQFERTILGIDEASGQPRIQVVRVRSNAGTKSFLQLKEWGSWSGCWLRTDLAAITRLTGVEVSKGSPLPTAVAVLAKAAVVGAGDGLGGPHLAVDAYSALQFLGVSGAAIAKSRTELSRNQVPVLLDVTPQGGPSGAAVEGSQVVAALTAAGVELSEAATRFIGKAHARVVLSDLSDPVQVASPPAAQVLPRHPAPTSTCPANG